MKKVQVLKRVEAVVKELQVTEQKKVVVKVTHVLQGNLVHYPLSLSSQHRNIAIIFTTANLVP